MELQQLTVERPAFTIRSVLEEAWRRVRGSKSVYWLALLFILAAVVALCVALALLGLIVDGGGGAVGLITQAAGQCVYLALQVGLLVLAIRLVRSEDVRAGMVFDALPKIVWLVLASVLTTILVGLGFVLLILPGIYLGVAYTFALPLIADRGLGVWEALETSRRGVTKCWFRVFFLYLLVGLIAMLSAIPLGIGLIWTIPLALNTAGILYREIFSAAPLPQVAA